MRLQLPVHAPAQCRQVGLPARSDARNVTALHVAAGLGVDCVRALAQAMVPGYPRHPDSGGLPFPG